jgi:hypothetical protein
LIFKVSPVRRTLFFQTFDTNPFFDNDVIIKEYSVTEASETQCKSTPIRWKNVGFYSKKNDFMKMNSSLGNKKWSNRKKN